jgi:hypothetical protein
MACRAELFLALVPGKLFVDRELPDGSAVVEIPPEGFPILHQPGFTSFRPVTVVGMLRPSIGIVITLTDRGVVPYVLSDYPASLIFVEFLVSAYIKTVTTSIASASSQNYTPAQHYGY